MPAMEAHKLDPNTGEDQVAQAQSGLAPVAPAKPAILPILRPGARSGAMRIALRFGPEVQALPRPLRLNSRLLSFKCKTPVEGPAFFCLGSPV